MFLFLFIAVAIIWGVLYYVVWQKPEILSLVPDTPVAYISVSNLERSLSDSEISEFMNRLAQAPFLSDFKSTRLGKNIMLQKRAWERQLGGTIDRDTITTLMGKDAHLALYNKQGRWDFLLLSEVGLLTRINLTSNATKQSLGTEHKAATEKYKGIELISLGFLDWTFSYGFIGRAGMLSTDKSLLKEAIDHYRDAKQKDTGFKKIITGPSNADIFYYVDISNVLDILEPGGFFDVSSLRTNTRLDILLSRIPSVSKLFSTYTGSGSRQNGTLRFDSQIQNISGIKAQDSRLKAQGAKQGSSVSNLGYFNGAAIDNLFVPANCLSYIVYNTLEPDSVFEIFGSLTGLKMDSIRHKLVPLLHTGAAMAVLEPNVKEFQLLPPVMLFFTLKDKKAAETALGDIKGSFKTKYGQLDFAESEYENARINYTRLPIGMGMSLDVGYTITGDNLLILATDTSALKAAIDTSLGKCEALSKNKDYARTMSPIALSSGSTPIDGQAFINIRSIASMTRQAARLYAWQASVAGKRAAERVATLLYQNASLLESWHYIGVIFDSENDKTNIKLVLNSE